jgi:hypothetical protein
MSSKYEFHNPTGDDQTVSPGVTPVTVVSCLTGTKFYPGTTEIQIHNRGPGYAYFYNKAGAVAPAAADMRPLAVDMCAVIDWQEKGLKKIWIATDNAGDKVIISQSGI